VVGWGVVVVGGWLRGDGGWKGWVPRLRWGEGGRGGLTPLAAAEMGGGSTPLRRLRWGDEGGLPPLRRLSTGAPKYWGA
jgi:hypothetical protein